MQYYGIQYHTSNSYIPQQNGLGKRKNRQLLKVVRASLFGMTVALEYWEGLLLTSLIVLLLG